MSNLNNFELLVCGYTHQLIWDFLQDERFAKEIVGNGSPLLERLQVEPEYGSDGLRVQTTILTEEDFRELIRRVATRPIGGLRDEPAKRKKGRSKKLHPPAGKRLTYRESGVQTRYWIWTRAFYKQSSTCIAEINRKLSKVQGTRWAKLSVKYDKQLKRDRLPLENGLQITRRWLSLARELDDLAQDSETSTQATRDSKALVQSRKTGSDETSKPSRSPQAGAEPPKSRPKRSRPFESDVALMRAAIAKTGKRATPDQVFKTQKINRQRGLNALRHLRTLGEYLGFKRIPGNSQSN